MCIVVWLGVSAIIVTFWELVRWACIRELPELVDVYV